MGGIILNWLFARDISVAHATGGGAVTYAIVTHHYVGALVAFALAVAISAFGEHALERR